MPIFQQDIQERDVKMGVYSYPVDRSTAGLIEAAGQLGLDAWKGKVAADLESGIDEAVNTTLESNSMEAEQSARTTGAFSLAEQIKDQEDDMGLTLEESYLDEAAKEYAGQYAKLQKLREQGNTTALKLRVESLTREAMNRMPGLSNEWVALANRTLGTYRTSIAILENQEASALKAQQNVRKRIDDDAYKLGVSPTAIAAGLHLDPTTPEGQFYAEQSRLNTRAAEAEARVRILEATQKADKLTYLPEMEITGNALLGQAHGQFLTFLNQDPEFQQMAGRVDSFSQLQNLPSGSQDYVMAMWDRFKGSKKAQFGAAWASKGFTDSDYSPFFSTLDTYDDQLKNLLIGQSSTTALTNFVTRQNKMIEKNAPVNIRVLQNLGMLNSVPANVWANLNVQALEYANGISDRFPKLSTTDANLNGQAFSMGMDGIKGAMRTYSTTGELPKGSDIPVNIINNSSVNPLSTKTIAEHINDLADPKFIDFASAVRKKYGVSASENIMSMADDFTTKAITNATSELMSEDSSAKGKLQLSINKEMGTVKFVPSSNATNLGMQGEANRLAAKWNAKYANRINQAIKARAHAKGNTRYSDSLTSMVEAGVFSNVQEDMLGKSAYSFTELVGDIVSQAVKTISAPISDAVDTAIKSSPDYQGSNSPSSVKNIEQERDANIEDLVRNIYNQFGNAGLAKIMTDSRISGNETLINEAFRIWNAVTNEN